MSKGAFYHAFMATHDALRATSSERVGMPSFFAFMTLLGGCVRAWVRGCVQLTGSKAPAAGQVPCCGAGTMLGHVIVTCTHTLPCSTWQRFHVLPPYRFLHARDGCDCLPAALRMFVEARLDVVVLEVGIGGRLDATNCVRAPRVSCACLMRFECVCRLRPA